MVIQSASSQATVIEDEQGQCQKSLSVLLQAGSSQTALSQATAIKAALKKYTNLNKRDAIDK
eukprot:721732-Ditylum_brightwellii.AAC.1